MTKSIPDVSDYLVYQVKTCEMNFEKRTQPIESEEIRSFSYGCDFNGRNLFPDFAMTILVDRKTFFDIMKERDSMSMNLKVTFKVIRPQEQDKGDKDRDRIWINDKFIAYIDDHQYELMVEESKNADEVYRYGEEEKKKDVSEHKEYMVTLNLYREKDINTAYHISNKVYTSTDKQTLVTHLLNQAGASNVLMSPFQNGNVTEAFTLPITLVSNLKYLATQYGLHSHGTFIFFDYDITYILNKKPGCTAWRPGENKKVVFVVRKDTDGLAFMAGSRTHEDTVGYINVDPHNMAVKSYSSIDSIISGGQIKVIDHWNNNTGTIDTAAKSRKKHQRYLHNKYRNKLKDAEMKQDMNDRGIEITLKTYDSNLHWFRPNKEFVFTFANGDLEKSLGGQYRLLSLFTIATNYGEYFRPESTVRLSKAL